jgi:ABC-type phosphate transport system substrate-binding protein
LRRGIVVLALLLTLVPWPRVSEAQEGEGYVVIVNASNDITEMSQDLVARMFLRKVRKWRNGQATTPVDQSMTAPVRLSFSKGVLGMTGGEVRDYWMKQTLSAAELPPAVRSSEREVLELVKAEAGAIAYVSAGTKLPAEVKAVKVTR